jgi:lysophospholipase L1-like esterase
MGPYILPQYYNGFVPYERKGRLDKKKGSKPKNDKVQINAFRELLDDFKKNNIQVILVNIPGYLPARDPDNIQESIALIHKIAEEKGIPFLDYETERITDLNTDPSLFSDWVHLNGRGSDAFTKLLKSDLELLLEQKKTKQGTPRT